MSIVVGMLLLTAVTASAQEATPEAGANTLQLPPIVSDTAVEARFEENVTGHLYFFLGSEGDEVTISLTQGRGAALDPFLVLLGPAGQVLAADDDGGDVSLSSLIEGFELPADGTYLIFATAFNFILRSDEPLEVPLAYTLELTGANPPAGADTETFQLAGAGIEIGDSVNGRITPQEPIFYFFFDGEEGDVIDIRLESTAIDPLLYLFDGMEGLRLAVNDDSDGLNAALEDIELPADGRYMIWATDAFFVRVPDSVPDYDDGAFELSVTRAGR